MTAWRAGSAFKGALAEGFEEDDGGGDRDVERADGAGGGDGDEEIAGFFDEIVEAAAFATKDKGDGACEVGGGVRFFGAFIETNQPKICLLQFFHGARKVFHASDGEVCESAGGGARDGVGEGGGAALGNDDAGGSGGERGANDGAEVVRVFDAIEENEESGRIFLCGGEEVFEIEGAAGGEESDDALMVAGGCEAVEAGTIFKADRNVGGAGKANEFFDAVAVAAAGDVEAVERAPGAQRFKDGVDAGEEGHGSR